ncbi:MAG: hypothetical protein HND47_21720 [Chloroflexi bacterium]|nr:hypothetical protein [Chloroflexota bacterium]
MANAGKNMRVNRITATPPTVMCICGSSFTARNMYTYSLAAPTRRRP